MKKILVILSLITGLAIATSTVVGADTPVTTAPTPTPSQHKEHEHHPAIHAAIRALEKAKTEMQAASHDFGGHRAEAIAQCEKAIEQLRLALQYDKN